MLHGFGCKWSWINPHNVARAVLFQWLCTRCCILTNWAAVSSRVFVFAVRICTCVCVSHSWLPLTSAESCFGWNTAWLTYQWCLLRDESIRAHERLLTARPSFVSSGGCHQSYRRLRSPERLIADHGFLSHPPPFSFPHSLTPYGPRRERQVWRHSKESTCTTEPGEREDRERETQRMREEAH